VSFYCRKIFVVANLIYCTESEITFFLVILLSPNHIAESSSGLYSEGARFESRQDFAGFHRLSREIPGCCFELGHGHCLLYPFQFIVQHHPLTGRCIVPSYFVK
jgi:hypothetical protein